MCDNRNKFCYICGLFIDKQHRVKLETNKAVKDAFNHFFDREYEKSVWYEPNTCHRYTSSWAT